MIGILGKKLGMTRVISNDGNVVPVTILECEPNQVARIKTQEKDGYKALVLGYQPLKTPSKTKKFKKVKEYQVDDIENFKAGDVINLDIFTEGDVVILTGVSKGKGFQGVVKRHHMAGGPKSHGSHFKREPGSVGARAKPGKIHRGKRLPGHMGSETKTTKTTVVYLDKEKNLIGLKGPVPGGANTIVSLKKS